MQRFGLQLPAIGRIAWFAALFIFVFLGIVAAVLFSSGAAFLSSWIIVIMVGVVSLLLLAWAPSPALGVQRFLLPISSLYLFLDVVWPRYATFRPPGMPAFSISRICLATFLLIGVFVIAKSGDFRLRLCQRVKHYRIIFIFLGFLFLFKIVGIPFSDLPFSSAKGVLNELLSVYLPMVIVLGAIESRNDIRKLLYGILGGMVVVLILAVCEYMLGRNLFIGLLEVDSDYMFEVLRNKMRGGAYRLQSTLAHPLTLAEFIVLAVPMAIFLAFDKGWNWWRLCILVPVLAVAIFVVAKTGSRAGIAGVAVAMTACAVIGAARLARLSRVNVVGFMYLLSAVMFVFFGLLVGYFLRDIIAGKTVNEISSGMVRIEMWQVGLKKAIISPVVGYGQDMAATVLGFVLGHGTLTIDSYYLSVLLDAGFFALGAYLFVLGGFLVNALRGGLAGSTLDFLSVCIASGIFGFIMIKAVLSLGHNHVIFMILMAIMMANLSILRVGMVSK